MKNFSKDLDLNEIYDIIDTCRANSRSDWSLKLTRFIDKVSDSDKFAQKVHEFFSKKRSSELTKIDEQISKLPKSILVRFYPRIEFRKQSNSSYSMFIGNEKFLDDLDSSLVRKICRDINVAFLIKSKRIEFGKE